MNPAQLRYLADTALAVVASGAALSPEIVRTARDDASAPQAELPAAAVRRVWLWAVASAAPSRSAAAIAAQVSRPTVRRACEAVEAWFDRDAQVADELSAVSAMVHAIANGLTNRAMASAVFGQALHDRRELERRRAAAPARKRAQQLQPRLARELPRLAASARAAGDEKRAEHFESLARSRPSQSLRTRDLHRGQPKTTAL